MPKAVQYRRFGGVDVLEVADVPRPSPGPGQALVAVRTTGINPGEARIRQGEFAQRWPSTFPSGQGSDLAGTVAAVGDGVGNVAVGDEVIGFTNDRAAQAEYVVVAASSWSGRRPSRRCARSIRSPGRPWSCPGRPGASDRWPCSSPTAPGLRSSGSRAQGITTGCATTASPRRARRRQ
jgi:hypothetical protein